MAKRLHLLRRVLGRETTWVCALFALSACASVPARHAPQRVDPVTPPGSLASVPPVEPHSDPEAVERRWPIEEARARELAASHAAAHKGASVDVLAVRGACADVDRSDYATCPLDLLRAGTVLQETPDGVTVHCPASGVDVERLRRLARCQATMSRTEAQGACPLWQPGARVVVRADSDHVTLEITAHAPASADEVRRRVGALFSAALPR